MQRRLLAAEGKLTTESDPDLLITEITRLRRALDATRAELAVERQNNASPPPRDNRYPHHGARGKGEGIDDSGDDR